MVQFVSQRSTVFLWIRALMDVQAHSPMDLSLTSPMWFLQRNYLFYTCGKIGHTSRFCPHQPLVHHGIPAAYPYVEPISMVMLRTSRYSLTFHYFVLNKNNPLSSKIFYPCQSTSIVKEWNRLVPLHQHVSNKVFEPPKIPSCHARGQIASQNSFSAGDYKQSKWSTFHYFFPNTNNPCHLRFSTAVNLPP